MSSAARVSPPPQWQGPSRIIEDPCKPFMQRETSTHQELCLPAQMLGCPQLSGGQMIQHDDGAK